MVPLDEPEFTRWRAAAERAREAAAAQAGSGFHEWACFLSEQAAQLGTKGILHGVGAGGWGHDLTALVARASEVLGTTWPSELERPAERLARYLPTRYPDAVPGGVPGDRFDAQDSADAARDALALLGAVDRTWSALLAEAEPT